jgi:hypothetical protein
MGKHVGRGMLRPEHRYAPAKHRNFVVGDRVRFTSGVTGGIEYLVGKRTSEGVVILLTEDPRAGMFYLRYGIPDRIELVES